MLQIQSQPLVFFLPCFIAFSPPLSTLAPSLCPAAGIWSVVGGSWGCRAVRASIQGNMHDEITIAPLGDLQMLAELGTVVGSYHHSSTNWEIAKRSQTDNMVFLLQPAPLASSSTSEHVCILVQYHKNVSKPNRTCFLSIFNVLQCHVKCLRVSQVAVWIHKKHLT